ncbi:ribosomal protein L35Ae-domain-containing protein [Syncephalastrum racemosum]|uniref:Ribosomal protein L35Ae-domain-containing protein n=1 Tax=Syncephalastrum racemosum TaxID=13706 RepID=A0A1X2H247_SYNRA|nr:ribosomal protein L35Ae-domain-containing protein [Syncephalastrum racemosum]
MRNIRQKRNETKDLHILNTFIFPNYLLRASILPALQCSTDDKKLRGKQRGRGLKQSFLPASFHIIDIMSARILTVGTGAVGAIYSWRLAQTCHVTAVCRSNYDAVSKDGFRMESNKFGKGIFKPHTVVRTVSEAARSGEPFDYIVVTLKALPDIYSVPDIIAPAVVEGKTTIVLIQNGIGVEEPVAQRFPNNPLISVAAYIGTAQNEPGLIQMTANVESLAIGHYAASKVDAKVTTDRFIELLQAGGVNANFEDNMADVRWRKVFWNGSFSPVCAILGLTTTQVLDNDMAFDVFKNLMRELCATATADTGEQYDAETYIETIAEGTRASARNYKPSMQLDCERKSPMEAEVIIGNPMRIALAHGLEVPTLEMILYSKGRVLGYERAKHTQNPNVSLLKLEGVQTSEDAKFYLGKRVAYVYSGKKAINGSKVRVIWGRIGRVHGNNGVVKARFRNNLPAKTFGATVRVMLYPSNI